MNCWIISTLFIHWESQIVLLHGFCSIPDSQLHFGMNNRCELWVFGILYFLNLTKLFLTRKFDEIPRVISRQRSHGALTRYSVQDKGLLRLGPGCGNADSWELITDRGAKQELMSLFTVNYGSSQHKYKRFNLREAPLHALSSMPSQRNPSHPTQQRFF